MGVNSSLHMRWSHQWSHLGLGSFFLDGKFWNLLAQPLVVSLFWYFSFRFGCLCFGKFVPCLGYLICWHTIIHRIIFPSLLCLWCECRGPAFYSWFSLVSLAKGWPTSLIVFNGTNLWFHCCFLLFLFSILFICALIFIVFCLLLALFLFILLLLVSQGRCMSRLLIWDFYLLYRYYVFLWLLFSLHIISSGMLFCFCLSQVICLVTFSLAYFLFRGVLIFIHPWISQKSFRYYDF